MRLSHLHIVNFRRLKDVCIDLRKDTTIFVGANNSGKTSATHALHSFLSIPKAHFSIYDFSASCWGDFDKIGQNGRPAEGEDLPVIQLDMWFSVDEPDVHRVIDLLPSLEWKSAPIGVRLEFGPKDAGGLLDRFNTARAKVRSRTSASSQESPPSRIWPTSLADYLRKRLGDEYAVRYYVLDRSKFDDSLHESGAHRHPRLGQSDSDGRRILSSLVRVNFLNAQRNLADTGFGSGARSEDLSTRLGRFYLRNLEQYDPDLNALEALAESEAKMDQHFAAVFGPTLGMVKELGYFGPPLEVRSSLSPEGTWGKSAKVHYRLPKPGDTTGGHHSVSLPDRYNGLGFQNLIYMAVEVLDFCEEWKRQELDRPLVHLVIIEEPEAHLHVQPQRVFIAKITKILSGAEDELFSNQLIVTTHSPHIIQESNFDPIRYFRRLEGGAAGGTSEVLNVSDLEMSDEKSRGFLLKYMRLTHCDLFFADAAVLVEGNVERLLLPLMIDRAAPNLTSRYLSILELGGAFAHIFKNLLGFLGLPTLVITDLDSVRPSGKPGNTVAPATSPEEGVPDAPAPGKSPSERKDPESPDVVPPELRGNACMTTEANAITSNQTLSSWIPGLSKIQDLLDATEDAKCVPLAEGKSGTVRVAYQTRRTTHWRGEENEVAGRTFEEAFAYENLEWCQDPSRRSLGLRVVSNGTSPTLTEIENQVHDRIRGSLDKTKFALNLMMLDDARWIVPFYIQEGLQWLAKQFPPEDPKPIAKSASEGLQ